MNKLIAIAVAIGLVIAALTFAPADASANSPAFLAAMLGELPQKQRPERPEEPEVPDDPRVFGPVAPVDSIDAPDPIWDAPYRSGSSETIDVEPVVIGETGSCYRESPLTNEEVVERIWDRRR